jgi:hypothetical protein
MAGGVNQTAQVVGDITASLNNAAFQFYQQNTANIPSVASLANSAYSFETGINNQDNFVFTQNLNADTTALQNNASQAITAMTNNANMVAPVYNNLANKSGKQKK